MAEKGNKDSQNTTDQPLGMVRLKGINWPWMATEEALDALKTFDVWDDDVWVTTYPKAGTHWTLEIVNLILVDGHEDKIDRTQAAPPAEFDFTQPRIPERFREPLPQFKLMKIWKAPRATKAHLTEERMPDQIHQGKGKVIYVMRNPKDIAVSLFHFVKTFITDPRYDDWDFFFQEYLDGDSVYGSWFDHVLGFWNKHRYDKNFLFLKYEDMKQDTRGAVIQIADFLGRPLSEDAIDRVVEFCSLKSMKTRFTTPNPFAKKDAAPPSSQTATESTPFDGGTEKSSGKPSVGAPLVMRKGIVGDWKTKFTVAQNEAFDELYKKKMAGTGLKMQFE